MNFPPYTHNQTVEFWENKLAVATRLGNTKEASRCIGALLERASRFYVGEDDKGNKAFVAKHVEYDMTILSVEGRPSGWEISNFHIEAGHTQEVCYDGGSNWYGKITFDTTI